MLRCAILRRSSCESAVRLVRCHASRNREWNMLPSGQARWTLLKAAEPDAFQVKEGHVVRMQYVARLDDGRECAKGTLSYRIGSRSDGVCAAVEEASEGMRLGDTRRVRAAPQSRRSKMCESTTAISERVFSADRERWLLTPSLMS